MAKPADCKSVTSETSKVRVLPCPPFWGIAKSVKAHDFDSCIRRFESYYPSHYAELVELADTPDLGSGVARRRSSSLLFRTI